MIKILTAVALAASLLAAPAAQAGYWTTQCNAFAWCPVYITTCYYAWGYNAWGQWGYWQYCG